MFWYSLNKGVDTQVLWSISEDEYAYQHLWDTEGCGSLQVIDSSGHMRCTGRLIRCQVRLGGGAFACFGQPNRTRTFQWFAAESTSGLDRACVLLLPLFQPREPLPRQNSCGLETWHYLFVLYSPPCSFPTTSPFWNQRNRMFSVAQWQWALCSPSSENNRLSDTAGPGAAALTRRWSCTGNSWWQIPLSWTVWALTWCSEWKNFKFYTWATNGPSESARVQ